MAIGRGGRHSHRNGSRPIFIDAFAGCGRMPDTFAAGLRGKPLGNGLDLVPIFAEMRSAGIDFDWWFRAKSIEAISGPMAEAKLTGELFDEVWNGYSSECDVMG